MMSHLIKIYTVCKFSYFRLCYLKNEIKTGHISYAELGLEIYTCPLILMSSLSVRMSEIVTSLPCLMKIVQSCRSEKVFSKTIKLQQTNVECEAKCMNF